MKDEVDLGDLQTIGLHLPKAHGQGAGGSWVHYRGDLVLDYIKVAVGKATLRIKVEPFG